MCHTYGLLSCIILLNKINSSHEIYNDSLVVGGKKYPNPEKNGRELNLVSIDAEFPIDRHIQNPLKSSIGKKFYDIF